MNIVQKIICGIGGMVLLYFIFNISIGDRVDYVIVKHKDRLVEYICKDREELKDIVLKSNNDVLFFDGEYFYDEPPTYKGDSRVKLVKWDTKVVRGDMDSWDYFWSIFAVLICVLILCGATSSTDDDYEYDM
ncbi:hypothetical protein KBA63_04015 [Candidatus Woesebacteria bacterium]|nr:hypothetical protein [Candidatus Woesebacteria bacterium]